MRRPRRLVPAVLAGALVLGGGDAPADVAERALADQKMKLVERLLARGDARSAGSRSYQSAQILLESARVYLGVERFDLVTEALDEALRLAAEVAREASASHPDRRALASRYRELEEGVRTFRQAHLDAVGGPGEHDEEVDRLLAAARRHAAAGDHQRAVTAAARAYDLVARALAAARAHETVEHRLVFATPADEYRYERERFRSGGLLVQLVLSERPADTELRAGIEREVDQATRLDREATAVAGAGDVEAAIRLEEQATAHLMRALAMAGLFIPR